MKSTYYIFFFVLLVLYGCRKDKESETTTITTTPGPVIVGYAPDVQRVNAVAEGFIHNELDQPLANAQVTLGSDIVFTDAYGYFEFPLLQLNKFGEPLLVEHPGYYDANLRFYPSDNSRNPLKLKLTEKSIDQISGNSGGMVVFPGGSLEILPRSLLTLTDSIYSGTIDIAVTFLDPNQQDGVSRLIGNHFGVNRLLEEVVVNSFGVVMVEVLTSSGNPLKIMENDSMKPVLRIPVSPAIPIWYQTPEVDIWTFYAPYSAWAETGIATKVGNRYETRLNYFGHINLGQAYPAGYYDAEIVDFGDVPHTNSIIGVSIDSIPLGYDVIDNNGFVSGYYPESIQFGLDFYDLCGLENRDAIPSISGNQNFGQILITNGYTQIKADVTCNGIPVNDYIVNLNTGTSNNYYKTGVNDTLTLPACQSNPNSSITILDPVTQSSSSLLTIVPGTFTDLGNIELCNPLVYSIQFNYDTIFNYSLQNPVVDTTGGKTRIQLNPGYLEFYGNSPGNYGGQQMNYFTYHPSGVGLTGALDSMQVTNYTGNEIIGVFEGTLTDTISTQSVFVKGDFHVSY